MHLRMGVLEAVEIDIGIGGAVVQQDCISR